MIWLMQFYLLLENDPQVQDGQLCSRNSAKEIYMDHQVKQYLEWYQQILESRYQHVLSKIDDIPPPQIDKTGAMDRNF